MRSYARPIAWALATLVFLVCSFEIAARVGFLRISRIESRIYKDYTAARAIRRQSDSKSTILLLGNSLLLEGLDYDRIRTALQPDAIPTRFVIEQTTWLDWFYAIRRLFAEGSRPDRIVLCLDVSQMLSNTIRGDYSAFYLIKTGDLVEAGRSSGFNLSRTSDLFFAHYSLFYAGLNNIRNFVLNRVAPSYAETMRNFSIPHRQASTDAEVLAVTSLRLERLQSVCSRYRTRCDILVPPGFRPPAEYGLIEAGKRTGTRVLIPVPLNSWGKEMYRDGFHLTPEAAVRFTDLLASALRQP